LGEVRAGVRHGVHHSKAAGILKKPLVVVDFHLYAFRVCVAEGIAQAIM
jgi:hypothetical protein